MLIIFMFKKVNTYIFIYYKRFLFYIFTNNAKNVINDFKL